MCGAVICTIALLLVSYDRPNGAQAKSHMKAEYWEKEGPNDCRVTLYADIYDPDGDVPSVEIYWDGKPLFAGRLTTSAMQLDVVTPLVVIHTNPGSHLLEVRSGGDALKQAVDLGESQNQNYLLFGRDREGKSTLLQGE